MVDHSTRDGLAAAPRNFMLFQLLLPLARAIGNLGSTAAISAAAIPPLLEPWRGWAYLRAARVWEGACESGEGILLLALGRPDEAVERLIGGVALEDRLGATKACCPLSRSEMTRVVRSVTRLRPARLDS